MADEKYYIPIIFTNWTRGENQIENIPVNNHANFDELVKTIKTHFSNMRYTEGGRVITKPEIPITCTGTRIDTLNNTEWVTLCSFLPTARKHMTPTQTFT